MAQKSRDEFSEGIKRTVAERAAYICTNPDCQKTTIGPHSDPDKSLKIGEVCHIRAAAAGGPRYDPDQTPDERGNINNAIWLCTECSTKIDKDEKLFSPDLLLEWKLNHEKRIMNGSIIPCLPELLLTTIKGRTLPEVPSHITVNDCEDSREHLLKIKNCAYAEILMVDAHIQFPEPIIENFNSYIPAGINMVWQPVRLQMVGLIKGGGTITRNRPPLPTNVYRLQIDRLPPSQYIEIGFTTSTKILEEHDISFEHGPFAHSNQPPNLLYFIDGTFQYEYRGATLKRRFFAPIQYDKVNRQFSILEVRDDFGEWKPLTQTFFS